MPRRKPSPELPAESSGAVEAVTPPSEIVVSAEHGETHETTIGEHTEENSPNLPNPEAPEPPVMARLRQKAQEEAESGTGAPKGPHPYEYTINSPGNVPEAHRDSNYDIDTALIDDHLQRCHEIGTTPQIPGLLIGRRV